MERSARVRGLITDESLCLTQTISAPYCFETSALFSNWFEEMVKISSRKVKILMGKNDNLTKARGVKNDEFYTQYNAIEKEMNAYLDYDPNVFRGQTILLPCDDPEWSNFTRYFAENFQRFGIKKLISTSYAPESKGKQMDLLGYEPSELERSSTAFDATKTLSRGKIFVLNSDENLDGRVDIDDLRWEYLEEDGDFRSDEVMALRDEADIIITNPPFSLFREYMAWIMEAGKRFVVIANKNCITYKEIFPLIKDNKMWAGNGFHGGNAFFRTIHDSSNYSEGVYDEETKLVKFRNVDWFTNIEHGRRHQPIPLMSMADNLKFPTRMQGRPGYDRYDNYDAIDVPFTNTIPSDYDGVMGVPISFLDKYCPEQFEIIGATESEGKGFSQGLWDPQSGVAQATISGKRVYKRIFIRKRTS